MEPAARRELTLVPHARQFPKPLIALAFVYLVACAYHWFQSRAHVTPAVFGDELLYSKLAQSLAAGNGFTVRGAHVFFPAPLAAFLQAPVWLIHSTPTAYAVVKALNVAVMTSAVFPTYFIARRLVRPSFAVGAAAIAVAGPSMLYAPYLMSEALAYPVFLFALATMLRAIDRPSRRMEVAVIAVSAAAVLTRLQFIVVPLVYLVAAPLAGRLCGEKLRCTLRRHALSLGVLGALVAVPVVTGGAVLGSYAGARSLHYDPGTVLSWTWFAAALLPFAAGWLVVPGALLGLAVLAVRPRGRTDAGFALLGLASVAIVLLEVAMIAAGEANRAIERYDIYLVPIAAIAFFAYAERGAPWLRVYAGLALAGAATAWLMPFPERAGTSFTFDSPTLSIYAQLDTWFGNANAATFFAAIPLFGGIALALLPLRHRAVPVAIGAATVALLLLSGIPAYAGDHAMTRGTLLLRAGDPPDWLDRSKLGPADYLELPGGSAHYGWLLEAWNRDFRHAIQLGLPGYDGYASYSARIDRNGRFLVDGRRPDAGIVVVNDLGTAIEFEGGKVVARPRDGLTAYRLPAAPYVRSLVTGISFDRWAASSVRAEVWPRSHSGRGRYEVVVALPRGFGARQVTFALGGAYGRSIQLKPGERRTVRIEARGYPAPALRIVTDRADYVGAGTANARFLSLLVPSLEYSTQRTK
ncbi:MAG: hypothetical protein ABI896_06085 [Actinomycetota bacterium]